MIRRQRELHELSLRRMASLAGISNPYLSQIERGQREPSSAVVEAIADALEVTTEALYDAAGIAATEEEAAEPGAVRRRSRPTRTSSPPSAAR